jgi:branched-chain amino acid transport system substrate-binding protein
VRRVALAVLAAVATAVVGCGSPPSTRVTASTLTVFTSLPLRGDRAAQSRAILRGEKVALNQFGARIGGKTIGLVALDDAGPKAKGWTPEQTAANAAAAIKNPTTIAYIGDVDSGATAISLPLTNGDRLLQVSPLSGYTGLTRPSDKGEPAKYYPSQLQTFARLTPNGLVEARALASWLKRRGAGKVALVVDEHQDGQGAARDLTQALDDRHLEIVDDIRVAQHSKDVSKPIAKLIKLRPQAIVYAGASPQAAALLLRAAHAALPAAQLFATSAAAQDPLARLLGSAAPAVHVMSPLLPAGPGNPRVGKMSRAYRRLFGVAPPPAAFYGYEAMRSVLQAIRDAGTRAGDRVVVIAKYFDGRPRRSVLGTYTIGRHGDTTLDGYGLYGVAGQKLVPERRLHGGPG